MRLTIVVWKMVGSPARGDEAEKWSSSSKNLFSGHGKLAGKCDKLDIYVYPSFPKCSLKSIKGI